MIFESGRSVETKESLQLLRVAIACLAARPLLLNPNRYSGQLPSVGQLDQATMGVICLFNKDALARENLYSSFHRLPEAPFDSAPLL